MTAGELYKPSDSELAMLRHKAHRLCTQYNMTFETDEETRCAILRELLPDFDEEEFRQDIRNTIDECSVGGGYAFAGFPIGVPGDPGVKRAYSIMRDEAHWYGRKVYGYSD